MRPLIRALAVGVSIDLGGTFVGAVCFGALTGVVDLLAGTPAVAAPEPSAPSVRFLALLLGGLFSLLAGYVAAAISPQIRPLLVGSLVACVSLVLLAGVNRLLASPSEAPPWAAQYVVTTCLLTVAGSFLAHRFSPSSTPPGPDAGGSQPRGA